MPKASVSEADFQAVSSAAVDAYRRGDHDAAHALDKVARKINAALSHHTANAIMRKTSFPKVGDGKHSWRDVPSVLEPLMNTHPNAPEHPKQREEDRT